MVGMLLVGATGFAADPQHLLPADIAAFAKAYDAWDLVGFMAASEKFTNVCFREPKLNRAFYWCGAAELHLLLNLLGDKGEQLFDSQRGKPTLAETCYRKALAVNPKDRLAKAGLESIKPK